MDDAQSAWWQRRPYLIFLTLLAAVPLLWPAIPPLTDVMGHIGRYSVELAPRSSPLFRYYDFRWALSGNLGVDLLIVPLSKLFGIETGVKLIALAIPPLTVAGWLWAAREAHGRVPATAAFALPLAYGYPFQFGFINFCLSMALASVGFALWLRWGRKRAFWLRAWLFVPTGLLLWLCHIYGWAVLALLALACEIVREKKDGRPLAAAIWHGGLACLPLAPPLLLMAAWRSGAVGGHTGDWFNWHAKWIWTLAALRERWASFDLASVGLIYLLILFGVVRLGFRMNTRLGIAALFLLAAYLLLPRILIGSAYADMRLVPYLLAFGVLALRPHAWSPDGERLLAVLALAFYAARIGGSTDNFLRLERGYQAQLEALPQIRRGAAVEVLVTLPCQGEWTYSRMDHLGALAIGRREAFINGQWTTPGAQLLSIRDFGGGRFVGDPTQLLRPRQCKRFGEPILEDVIANLPRTAFDYLWMIDRPLDQGLHDPTLVPIWHGRASGILYRVVPGSATTASDTPNGSEPRATQ